MRRVPNSGRAIFSTHCHDDLGLAVANSLAAIQGGVRQVECTINGIGERAGNASLEEIVMALRVRQDRLPYDTAIVSERLFDTSQLLSRVTEEPVQANKAIVGRNAFAHEAGIHQDGMLKDSRTYEIMQPARRRPDRRTARPRPPFRPARGAAPLRDSRHRADQRRTRARLPSGDHDGRAPQVGGRQRPQAHGRTRPRRRCGRRGFGSLRHDRLRGAQTQFALRGARFSVRVQVRFCVPGSAFDVRVRRSEVPDPESTTA